MPDDVRERLSALMAERVLVLDGAMGTAIQAFDLGERDYRGNRCAGHATDLKGDHDVLTLTRPDVVEAVHRGHLEAGADMVSTDTFTANGIAQLDYGLVEHVEEMNRAAAEIARRTAPGIAGDRFVASTVGPGKKHLVLSPDINDAATPSAPSAAGD